MATSGFTGLSYPFRVSSQGGAVLTTTDSDDSSHIDESIRQILGTSELERPMELDIYSNLDSTLFEPNDEALHAIIKSIIVEDLTDLEDRISVEEDNIEITTDLDENGVECLFATITYTILKWNTETTTTFNLGEVNG